MTAVTRREKDYERHIGKPAILTTKEGYRIPVTVAGAREHWGRLDVRVTATEPTALDAWVEAARVLVLESDNGNGADVPAD